MARKKVELPCRLTSWDAVDKAMKEIISCEGSVDEINADLNRRIADIKQKADNEAKVYYDKIKALEVDIKEFVVKHREEFEGKTKQLNFGKTGFRLSTSLVVPSNKTADIIASLKRYNMTDCLNIKESINKDVLKKYPSEDILKTGAYLKSTDDFWYEVEKHDVKSTEA